MWKLFAPGRTGQVSFKGKMGLYRVLRSDETIIGFIPGDKPWRETTVVEKVLGRKAWRFPAGGETDRLLAQWVRELNNGTDPDVILGEIEKYWAED